MHAKDMARNMVRYICLAALRCKVFLNVKATRFISTSAHLELAEVSSAVSFYFLFAFSSLDKSTLAVGLCRQEHFEVNCFFSTSAVPSYKLRQFTQATRDQVGSAWKLDGVSNSEWHV